MAKKNIKDLTKNPTWETETVTSIDLQASALMRIADASEVMAKNSLLMAQNYNRMQNDLEFYKKRSSEREKRIEELMRSNSALRGVITKLKNKEKSGEKFNDTAN